MICSDSIPVFQNNTPDGISMIRRVAAYILLTSVYSFTWLVAVLADMIPRRRWKPTGRIMVTGTFHNPGWYMSHVIPLSRSGVKDVILVIDEPQLPLENVRFVCPPKWLAKLISRAGAKAIWMIFAGFRYRPDLFMGYNLAPASCTALVAGSIFRRPSCYQMTGGQLVLSTIGVDTFDSEKASRFQRKISRAIERLAIRVIRQFDLIVVRGSKGRAFLAGYGITDNVAIITGGVKGGVQLAKTDRQIDLIFVGRLNPIKQVDQFIHIVSEVSHVLPLIRAVIVGDGALMADLKVYASKLGIMNNIEFLGKRNDVEEILSRSRIFVLTSKSEGLSIAMAEAMMAGTVPVVPDVGELGDLVHDGINGYLIKPNDVNAYVTRIISLLQDQKQWSQLSLKAAETAKSYSHVAGVSEKWRRSIQHVVGQASGSHTVSTVNRQQS